MRDATMHEIEAQMAATPAMMDRRALMAALLGTGMAGLLAPHDARAWRAPPATPATAFPALRAALATVVGTGKLPGALAVLGRGTKEQAVIAHGVRGFGLSEPVGPDTLWRVYSMTKLVTGIATMMLIEQKKLTLDQPLADLIPAFAKMMVQVVPDGPLEDVRPAKTAISIRHLLTHTAGLGYTVAQKGPLQKEYFRLGLAPGKISKLPLPGFPRDVVIAPSLEEFATRLASLPLVYEPGTRWSYSVSLDLLGRVIEIASGMPFDAFLKARLFDPLGMKSTFFTVPKALSQRMTTNYGVAGSLILPIDTADASLFYDKPEFPFGGAGLVSTGADFDRFLNMLLGEGALGKVRVLRPETARLAMSNLLPEGVDTKGSIIAGQGFGAGGRVTLPGHSAGAGIYGWGGAAGTIAFVDTQRKLRMGAYIQAMPPDAFDLTKLLAPALMRDIGSAKA